MEVIYVLPFNPITSRSPLTLPQVSCMACKHESVRFDPFTYLTLPLPMEALVYAEALVLRLDGQTPVK